MLKRKLKINKCKVHKGVGGLTLLYSGVIMILPIAARHHCHLPWHNIPYQLPQWVYKLFKGHKQRFWHSPNLLQRYKLWFPARLQVVWRPKAFPIFVCFTLFVFTSEWPTEIVTFLALVVDCWATCRFEIRAPPELRHFLYDDSRRSLSWGNEIIGTSL